MNMQAFASRAAALLAVAALLGGCSKTSIPSASPALSAGSDARAAAPASTARGGKKAKVEMRIKVPRAPKHARGKARRPYFVAASTLGVKIVVYAHGAHTTPLATAAVGLSSANCNPVTGGRTCIIPVAAPIGNSDFEVTTYDAPPTGGSFSSANQLGVGSATLDVKVDTNNSINITLGGVVAKGVVALTTASIPAIDTASQTVTISAQDADSNTIIGSGWFDASGDPVTMSVTSNQPSVTFSPSPNTATFAAPALTATYWAQDPTPTQIQNGFTATITATPSNAGATAGSATLTIAKPTITEYGTKTTSKALRGIAVGPDNALWFTECATNKIGRITTAGTITNEFSTGITNNANPISVAAGSDGNLWFTEFGLGKVASITTSGTVKEYLTPSGATSSPYGIVSGPDGNMWFAEDSTTYSNIGKFSPTAMDGGLGLILEFTTATASSGPAEIAAGPDGKLWFTETGVDKIGSITTAGTGAADFALTANSLEEGGITAGSDGNMWFAEENPGAGDPASGHAIGNITTSGATITRIPFTNTFTSPAGIVTGPDGAIWFAENGNNSIGRISPTDTNHTIVEFPLPTANGNPVGIVKGPDGALWFTECLTGLIGRLQ
jgi:virginiamycin B lyase